MRLFFLVFLFSQSLVLAQNLAEESSSGAGFSDGEHYVTETPFGKIAVGVSKLDSDHENGTRSGNLELGYVFEMESKELLPKLVAFTPFYINRFESVAGDHNLRAGDGLGWQLSWGEKGNPFRWIFRNTFLYQDDSYYFDERDERVSIEFMFGFEYILPGVSDNSRLQDLRNINPEILREINFRGTPPIDPSSGFASALRVSLLSGYFLELLLRMGLTEEFYFRPLRGLNRDQLQLDVFKMIRHFGKPGHRNQLYVLIQDKKLSFETLRPLVEESIGDWLLQQLRYEVPLYLRIQSSSSLYCMMDIQPRRELKESKGCENGLFDSDKVFDEFISTLTWASLVLSAM